VITIIKNGRVVDPANKIDEVRDIYLRDGFILSKESILDNEAVDDVIDASNRWVVPGFIDLNSHLREPGYEHKATISSETKAAAMSGYTALCCSPDSDPVLDTPAVVQFILDKSEAAGFAKVLPAGALTVGLQGEVLSEMSTLKEAGCVAMSQAPNSNISTETLRCALRYAETFDLTVILKPEDVALRNGGCVHAGITSSRLGLPGISQASETVAIAQIIALVEETGARVHITGISTAKAVKMLARAQSDGLCITADVHALQLHLTEQDMGVYDANYHLDPPLRTVEDRDALIAGVAKGVITAVISGHQPHEPDAKLAPFPSTEAGISCLETVLPLMLDLVETDLFDAQQMVASLSYFPAKLLGLELGTLTAGTVADLCIIDPNAEWTVSPESWFSQGLNTPFMGREMKGQVTHTFVNGNKVFER
jgi:dihydroorotase